MAQELLIKIIGDSKSYERALGRSAKASQQFSSSVASSGRAATASERQLAAATARETNAAIAATAAERDLVRVRARRASSIGPLRLAGLGVGAGVGLFAATQAIGQLRDAMKVSGEEAGTWSGRLRNAGAALLSGNVIGIVQALSKEVHNFTLEELEVLAQTPKVVAAIKELGGAADLLKAQIAALQGLSQVPQFLQTALSRSQAGAGGSTEKVLTKQLADNKRREAEVRKLAKLPDANVTAINAALDAIFQQRKAITDAIAGLNKKDVPGLGPREQKLLISQSRAGLGSLSDQLKAAKALAAFRKQQFDRAGPQKRFEAEQAFIAAEKEVLNIEKQISDVVEAQSKRRKAAAKAAIAAAIAEAKAARDALVATLDFAVTRTELTKSLQDDLTASRAREAGLRRLVALNRNDLDLANQLVSATLARRDLEAQIAENRRNAIKASQFKQLGLTAEGDKPTPGSGSLLKRALGLQERVKGTILDTPKTNSQLKKIVAFLKNNFNKAGKDVRAAILGMLNDISDGFDDKKTGPLTKTHGLRTAQIIKNLGLTADQADEIQRRLAHATTTRDRVHRGTTNAPGASGLRHRDGGRPGDRFVANVNVYIDGKKVSNTVTKQQQKDRRRNPPQKRGQHRN